ncbi:capsule assembly Wzi family protein [Flavihumibacter sp. UBA7668]|uniref:capsule assembly Wzi family protein n=1 Tax=Flavihumibacter sp. UBA7668 TaxID=1946542 RepID=UPI0025BBBE91|nr:capsule assembly Wzi family protein [Flavihumibacter sp. UBA7668]
MKYLNFLVTGFLFLLLSFPGLCQVISPGTVFFEEDLRINQLKGKFSDAPSFIIRPNLFPVKEVGKFYNWKQNDSISPQKIKINILPLILRQQLNTHHPYNWNDGSIIPAKGYQQQISAGFFLKAGPFTIQLQPELVIARNNSFAKFPSSHPDSIWRAYYTFLNHSDIPEQMGTGTYAKLFPGQSSVRLNLGKLSLALSTENLWWGPGVRNSLILSNTAPGFLHLSFNTKEPIKTPIGSFEWQLIGGKLKESGILPPDTSRLFEGQPLYVPKPGGNRYLNAVAMTWHPKWVNGLYLGLSRSFVQYEHSINGNFNDYLPVFSFFFKGNSRDESNFGRDQLLAFYVRWVFEKEAAEIYAEYGRNDHSGDAVDFLVEPEHSRAYIVGLKKLFQKSGTKPDIEFFTEFANLESGKSGQLRDIPTWYQHHQIKHGYTHFGQVLGAGIGPGSNSQTFGINWIQPAKRTGLFFERIARQNDFYYDAFTAYKTHRSHWVDLSLNGNKSWKQKNWMLNAQLSVIYSLNYQWRNKLFPSTLLNGKTNVTNIFAGFTIAYLLN